MLLKEAPTLFPQHLKNSLLNLGLIDKETCTLSTLNTVIFFGANKVWFLCWILSEASSRSSHKQTDCWLGFRQYSC